MKNKDMIGYLQDALRMELTAVVMYRLHSVVFGHLGYKKLSEMMLHESEEEQGHADSLMGRLLFLHARPDVSTLDEIEYNENIKEVFTSELDEEEKARDFYESAVQCARENGDSGTRVLFEQLLRDEEGHILFLRQQLHLIESLGIDKYLQSQI